MSQEPEIDIEISVNSENEPGQAEDQAATEPDYKDQMLRIAADFDNFRKRTARERETLVSTTRFELLAKFLPVLDNLERAASQPCADEPYADGVRMIAKQWLELMEKVGVTPIDALGKPFDPNLHNAVMHIEDPEQPQNTVIEVFQTGYESDGRVLRHSMVKVVN